jgi:hypothetical protein
MKTLAIFICLLGVTADAAAQGVIAGAVSDAWGTAVPGVAVEAVSSALMEDTRAVLSDGAGRYRLEDLPPATYLVRFTLAGWKTHQVEAVHATASMTGANGNFVPDCDLANPGAQDWRATEYRARFVVW